MADMRESLSKNSCAFQNAVLDSQRILRHLGTCSSQSSTTDLGACASYKLFLHFLSKVEFEKQALEEVEK